LSARRHTSFSQQNAAQSTRPPPPLRLFTAYIDQVTFKDKGQVGDRIMLTSQCCRSFGGILEIEVKAEAYKAHESPRLINVAYFCVAGVDGCGQPLVFPDAIPETDDERSRHTMSQVLRPIYNRFSALIDCCQGRMLVAAIKADALSSEDTTPAPSTAEDASPFSTRQGSITPIAPRRTHSAAVMNSTFSFTLLKRAQLSSIWNAGTFDAHEAEHYCALAHTCLVVVVKAANDATVVPDFGPNEYFLNPPPQYSSVDFKCRESADSVTLVAAVPIAATREAVGTFVSMGLGEKWNAVFFDASNTTTLDSSSLALVLSTVRMKSAASSFRLLQVHNDALQSERAHNPSQTIVALRSVGPLSAAVLGSAGSGGNDLDGSVQLFSGFVIDALDDGHSRVSYAAAPLTFPLPPPLLPPQHRLQKRALAHDTHVPLTLGAVSSCSCRPPSFLIFSNSAMTWPKA
jgi:hypothetical protein